MKPISIKKHEWDFANMVPRSTTKHKMEFGNSGFGELYNVRILEVSKLLDIKQIENYLSNFNFKFWWAHNNWYARAFLIKTENTMVES